MRRRLALALLATLPWTAAPFAQAPAAPPKPVVVLVSLDTFRADRLAAWGGSATLAPQLNAFAAKGRVFESCYTPAPVTLPAHAALLTGCSPQRAGLLDNGEGTLSKAVPTLAEAFAAAGYRTAAVVGASVLDSRYGLDRGFQVYDDSLGPQRWRDAADVTERAVRLVSQRTGPLFLWVHYFNTHEPYTYPQAFEGRAGSPYDRAAAYVDAEVGRLLSGLPADAVVAVVSDHGESLGEHGEETHGATLYQAAVRTVCLLSAPGVETGRDARTCSLLDLAPTLASLAGLPPLKGAEGRRLDAPAREEAGTVQMFTLLPFSSYRWRPLSGVTDGRFKWVQGKEARLFDLKGDPAESKDLSAAPPSPAAELKRALKPFPRPAAAAAGADPALRGLGYLHAGGGDLSQAEKLPDAESRLPLLRKVREAQQARTQGDLARAERLYGEVVEADPGNPSARFDLGETQRRGGAWQKAIPQLDRALALAPGLLEAWVSKGHCLVSADKPEEAAACYRKALELSPDSVEALNALAGYHLDHNKPDQAIPLLEQAVALGVANSGTYNTLGRIHLIQGKEEEARRDFFSALQFASDPPEVLKQQADTYLMRKYPEEAIRRYAEGIQRFPAFAPNYLTLAALYLEGEKPERALELFRKALACPLDPAERRNVEEIVADLEQVLAAPPQ